MSINGIGENDSYFKRRISNSLERNNDYYLFPNDKARNRTIECEDIDYFKPRIRKIKKINDQKNNNDYTFRNPNNDFRSYNRTYSSNHINVNKPHIPRIIRNKKNINKYINKTIREKEDQFNNYDYNQINNNINNNHKKSNSIEK